MSKNNDLNAKFGAAQALDCTSLERGIYEEAVLDNFNISGHLCRRM